MFKISAENIKSCLISFIGYTISYFWSKHHLRALHKVVHHCFQARLISFLVNVIEENLFWCCHLHSNVTLYMKYKSLVLKFMVKLPSFFTSCIIKFSFEKVYDTWRSYYKCLIVYQIHLTKILINDLFMLNLLLFNLKSILINWYCHGLSLSIKGKDLMQVRIEETLYWKVEFSAIHLVGWVAGYWFILNVVKKLVMNLCVVIEKVNIKKIIIDKRAVYERLRKVINWHRKAINTDLIINYELTLFDFIIRSSLFTESTNFALFKNSDFEDSIIYKSQS